MPLPPLQAVLDQLANPDAADALLATWAPDAPLYVGNAVRRAGDLTPEEYRAHRARAVSKLRIEDLTPLGVQQEGDRAVAWYAAHADRPIVIAAGWEGDRLGWLTLAPEPGSWTYEGGRLETLTAYIYAEPAGLPDPASWLDLAYHGLYAYADTPVRTLPDARYGCQMSGVCCDKRFEIRIPAASQAMVDALPWETLNPALVGTRLAPAPDGEVYLKHADEACRFLDDQRQCSIYKAVGHHVFPPCWRYPYLFAATPDGGLDVALQASCGSVRSNLGPPLAEQTPKIRKLAAMAVTPPQQPLRLTNEEVSWERFRAEEEALLALLADDAIPLAERLWQGLCQLTGATGPVPPAGELGAMKAELLLINFLQALPLEHGMPIRPLETAPHPDDPELTGMIRNMVFAKGFSFKYSLLAAVNVAILMYALVVHVRARHEDGRVPAEARRELVGWFLHWKFGYQVAGDDAFAAYMRAQLADPAFGTLLLGSLA